MIDQYMIDHLTFVGNFARYLNIVNIYIKQGRYQQALEILKSICLNNPEKSANFASQMRLLEVVVNNNKESKQQ